MDSNNPMRFRTHLSTNNIEKDLRRILDFFAQTSKYISKEIKKSNRKTAGTVNMYGEEQLALDVIVDNLIEKKLAHEKSFGIKDFVSEERDQIIHLNTQGGRYSIAADPLDGSSLVDVNLSIGTIIGVHDGPIEPFRPGSKTLVAAMYFLYGPNTTLVYTAGNGTHEFVQDEVGNFVLCQENIRLNEKGKIYSPGGNRNKWLPRHRQFINELEENKYKLRYSGGLVPDVNQILEKGGIFTYPELIDAPQGKLRLLFEAQPTAFIIESAGGVATNGRERILDLTPKRLDERTPLYLSTKKEVEKYLPK